jgi:hypothetical protein
MISKSPGPSLSLFKFMTEGVKRPDPTAPSLATAEGMYEAERAIVSSYRVVPLVWLPRVYGLSARVRDWTPPGPGESWPLADVWLDGPVEAAVEEGKQ